jgi:hypothetical protein
MKADKTTVQARFISPVILPHHRSLPDAATRPSSPPTPRVKPFSGLPSLLVPSSLPVSLLSSPERGCYALLSRSTPSLRRRRLAPKDSFLRYTPARATIIRNGQERKT